MTATTPQAIVLDASVLVAYVLPMDVHHAASHRYVRDASHTGVQLVAPRLLLAEVGGAVTRRLNNSTLGVSAIARVRALPYLRLVAVTHRLLADAEQLVCRLHLRGADSIYVAVAERLGVPLISWDKDHITRAAQAITVYTPDTAPHP
jgi:predicted nucleic acid-binding protein